MQHYHFVSEKKNGSLELEEKCRLAYSVGRLEEEQRAGTRLRRHLAAAPKPSFSLPLCSASLFWSPALAHAIEDLQLLNASFTALIKHLSSKKL